MRKVRIGNDINVRWEVKTDGQAVSLEGKALKLFVRSAYRKEEITTFTVEGCVVSFTYPASMQRMTGARAVILEDATEGAPRRTVCADQAFTLVAHSCEENDDDVEFEDFMISLQSNVLIGKPGLSAYEVWLSEGNTGTLEDWYVFLRKPATDIASDVAAAEAERTTAETARDKAEQARQGDENLRKTAEENRASAETGRSDAEQRRDANETSRESAEQMRKSAEADRIRDEKERKEAETSRKAAEKFRDTAENDRNDAEQERRQHEDARADAEGKRDTAETLRKQAETGRDNAEQERTTAEQTRQENETARVSAETERGKKETERIASETERKSSEQERKTAETGREEAETKREEAIVKFENDFNEKLSHKADLEEFNNTVSGINANIATKANAQDVTNAIGELQDKIDDIATADEEDITTEGDTPQTQVLKLKDRAYDSLNASGKGYKILRKNWQPINGERKNVLTQAMINEPNTIYEIRYDFDLNGEEINIPEGCVLSFIGGSLDKGIITGYNTVIIASPVKIFGEQIEINGTFVNTYNLPEWFSLNFTKTLESFHGIDFVGNYIIDKPITVDLGDKSIYLNFHEQSKITVNDDFIGDYVFTIANSETKNSKADFDANVLCGSGKIDLNERCGLIKFTKSNKYTETNHGKKCTFTDLIVYHAGKTIDGITPNFDSTFTPKTAIIYTAFNAVFTNCYIAATRNVNAKKPDCGIWLNGTDHKINRLTVITNTVGIYNMQSTYVNDCHVWGAPEIAFYATGGNFISKTYGDWAKCSFFIKGGSTIDITNHFVITTFTDESSPYYKGNNMVIVKLANDLGDIKGFLSYRCPSAPNARVVVRENDEGTELKQKFGKLKIIDISESVENYSSSKYYSTPLLEDYENDIHYAKITGIPYKGDARIVYVSDDNKNETFCVVLGSSKVYLISTYNCNGKFYRSNISEGFVKLKDNQECEILLKYINKYSTLRVVYTNNIYPFNITSITENDYNNRDSDYQPLSILNRQTRIQNDISDFENTEMYLEQVKTLLHFEGGKFSTCSIPNYADILSQKEKIKIGCLAFSKKNNKIGVWNGKNFEGDDFGNIDYKRKGETPERPILNATNTGYMYYDVTLKKYIVWNGTEWTNMDGSSLGEQPTQDESR